MLAALKRLANKRDVPYQSLLKVFLAERLQEKLQASGRKQRGFHAGYTVVPQLLSAPLMAKE